MMNDVEQAHAALADALWWLRGFAAAASDSNIPANLAEQLREARSLLFRMAEGKLRRIGNEQAIVLTYAEFERIYDAIGMNASSGVDCQSLPAAKETIRRVLSEYRAEAQQAAANSNIPF